MAALTTCIKRHRKALEAAGIDVDALKARARELRAEDGLEPHVAAMTAVEELIEEAEGARAETVAEVERRGGVVTREAAPEPVQDAPLAAYRNEKDGTEARIVRHDSGGYSVTLRDTDADAAMPVARIFPDMERADAYARSLVAAPGTQADAAQAAEPAPISDVEQAAPKERKFASTQLPVQAEFSGSVQAVARGLIDPQDIYPEKGLETDPHITLKYGLHTDAAQDVAPLLAGAGPIEARVEGIEVFEGVEDGRADAIVLRVESPKLRELNRRVSDALETTDTYPEYKPHITLGYVKAGQGRKYAGAWTPLDGLTITLSQVDFSARSGVKTPIALGGSQSTAELSPSSQAAAEGTQRVRQQKAAEEPAKAPIEDFGAVLEGARKHYAAAYREKLKEAGELDITTEPLSRSWPEPDYQRLLDDGADPWTVAFVHAARDEVPPKPRKAWKIKGWSVDVRTLRDFADDLLGGKKTSEHMRSWLDVHSHTPMNDRMSGRVDLYLAVGHTKSLSGVRVVRGQYSMLEGKPQKPPKVIWSVEKPAKASAWSNWPRTLAQGDTREAAIEAFKKSFAHFGDEKPAREVRFDIYSRRKQDGFFIGKKIGRNTIDLKRFDDVKSARAYLADHHDDLVKALEAYKDIPAHRKETNSPRVGIDHRSGGDVTPEAFAEAFGFRGVQFGNYVEGGRRQADLNEAYDALMDLAGILGVPPRALSLNGELGLAFGARGKGGKNAARAHYEPGTVVINLTKTKGAGSLAHEFFHALDNYFSRLRGRGADYLTESPAPGEGVRPEMVEAFGEVRKAIRATEIATRSRRLDAKRTKDYWSTGRELSARAFENYVIAKLADEGQSNDYLANIVSERAWNAKISLGLEEGETYPYLQAGEVPAVRAAFDNFFSVVETRETDTGVTLFSRTPTGKPAAAGLSVPDVERAIAKVRNAWKGGPLIKVVPSMDALPEGVRSQLGGGPGTIVEGSYYRGEVYLVADAIVSGRGARRILAHEVVGHHSMEEMLGDRFGEVLERVMQLWRAQDRALLPIMEEVIDRWGLEPGVDSATNAIFASEVIAVIAEKRPSEPRLQALLRTVREAVRRFLRRLGFVDLFSATDLDILISQAGRRLRTGSQARPPVDEGARFSTEADDGQKPGRRGDPGHGRSGQEVQVAFRTGSGGRPDESWRDSTRVRRKGRPARVFRGSREGLRSEDFELTRRGHATGHPSSGLGVFFSDDRADAEHYGGVVDERYLDVRKPKIYRAENMPGFDSVEDAHAFARKLQAEGYDGIIMTAAHLGGPTHVVAFSSEQIIEEVARFSRQYTPEQEAAIKRGKFGQRPALPLRQRIAKSRDNLKAKLRQGAIDQFDSFRTVLYDSRTWMMAQLTHSSTGALDATIRYGQPVLIQNAVTIRPRTKGLREVLEPLGHETDDFLRWIAGHRAERLATEGKERLFSPQDIAALQSLDQGTMADGRQRARVYDAVRQDFEALSAAVVQIAVDTGLVNDTEAQEWRNEGFYVPFYRLLEEEGVTRGPRGFSGLVRQNAYKKLTGADIPLEDLLTNVLLNWQHLLGASLKNQAARHALETAETMGLAQRKTAHTKGNKAVFVREDGKQVWYDLDSSTEGQLVLQALTALSFDGLNNFTMRVLRGFKRTYTVGVTASPGFKVRNLLRDSIQAVAVSGVSANVGANLYKGWKATKPGGATDVAMLAGGGSFGHSGYIHGADPSAIKHLVRRGIDRNTILTSPSSILRVLQRYSGWDAYQDFGARLENVNRAADFERAILEGKDLLEANFRARDHVDFSRTGAWVAVRALAQVVPFLNARLQGLDKLARSSVDPKQRRRFHVTVALYSLASVLLYLAMKDDDDYKAAEDWERDAYHLFKLPGSDLLFRIPRPFEVGAIASIAERGAEQWFDDEVHVPLFFERMFHALWETLSFNPMPQAFMPVIELYANKDTFTGRPIEPPHARRNMSPTSIKQAWTSDTAIEISHGMDAATWGKVVLSPVQIEHLVEGYFGWLGATTLGASDLAIRGAVGAPDQPSKRVDQVPFIKDFVRAAPRFSTRYTTEFYEAMEEANRLFGDIREARRDRDPEKAKAIQETAKDKLRYRLMLNRTSRQLTKLNAQIRNIRVDRDMTSERKRQEMDRLLAIKNNLTKRAVERVR